MTDFFDFTADMFPQDSDTEDGCYREPNVSYFEQFLRTIEDVFVDLPPLGDAA